MAKGKDEITLSDINEKLDFMIEIGATKEDLSELETRMDRRFEKLESDVSYIRSTVDTIQTEIGVMRSSLSMNERIDRLEAVVFPEGHIDDKGSEKAIVS